MSSKTIYDKVQEIKTEKDSKIIPGNIKKDVTVLGVTGTLESSVDINVFAQTTEPTEKDGIWLKTNEQVNKIITDTNIINTPYWDTDRSESLNPIPFSYKGNGGVVALGTNIYLFYGTAAYKYDTLTDTYTQLTNVPLETSTNGAAVTDGTYIYLIREAIIYRYNPLNDTYTRLTDSSMATTSSLNYMSVLIDNNIYYSRPSSSGTFKYDITNETSSKLCDTKLVINPGLMVNDGTDIYLCGTMGDGYGIIFKIDTLTGEFTELSKFPYQYYTTSGGTINYLKPSIFNMSIFNKEIYLFGVGGNAVGYNYTYKYNIDTNTYTILDNSLYSFSSGTSGAVRVKDDIYIFGTRNDDTKVQIFKLPQKIYPDNSVVIESGNLYETKLYSKDVPGGIIYKFKNVHYYKNGTFDNTIEKYYGNGTSWVQIT